MRAGESSTVPAVRLLLRYLEQEGVEYIFGIPGGPIIALYEALYDRGVIKPILTKHEAGAAFMADGYARVSGRIGVCCTTTGPGATNALTGVAVAYADHIPILVLTAQVPTHHFGKGAFQESSPESVDTVALYRPVTKWSTMIQHPDSTAFTMRKALRLMTGGRPGPVHINLPCNFATQPVLDELLPSAKFRFDGHVFDRAAVKEAAARMLGARRPVMLAGHGVNLGRAWGPLKELAERFRIPVATTFKAKGAFPEDHPLSLGVFCQSGEPSIREYVAGTQSDALLVIGTSLGEVSSCGWDARLSRKKSFLQIDIDQDEIGKNFPVDVALVGDASTVLSELRFQMERETHKAPDVYPRRPEPALPAPVEIDDEESSQGPLKPRAVLRELRESLPRDAALFVDNGTIRTWAGRYFPVHREGCFFVNMGMASMGYAVAGSIGGKLAAPERPVVALVGDAAFAMNGMEVHTAVEHDVPVVWVVINNGGHGMIYHGERMLYNGKFVSSIFRSRLEIVKIAEAMGAASFLVERPGELGPVLRQALALKGPCVVEVAVDLHAVPPMGARVQAIQKELAAA
ncbi:MAG: thiamine pyrophosphate-binding protein [Elusimicrobia bacterium]|nr:thiamine pyrophosphate-binding protein [Elusimicrobiota bacterium]